MSKAVSFHKLHNDPQWKKLWVAKIERVNLPKEPDSYGWKEYFQIHLVKFHFGAADKTRKPGWGVKCRSVSPGLVPHRIETEDCQSHKMSQSQSGIPTNYHCHHVAFALGSCKEIRLIGHFKRWTKFHMYVSLQRDYKKKKKNSHRYESTKKKKNLYSTIFMVNQLWRSVADKNTTTK